MREKLSLLTKERDYNHIRSIYHYAQKLEKEDLKYTWDNIYLNVLDGQIPVNVIEYNDRNRKEKYFIVSKKESLMIIKPRMTDGVFKCLSLNNFINNVFSRKKEDCDVLVRWMDGEAYYKVDYDLLLDIKSKLETVTSSVRMY